MNPLDEKIKHNDPHFLNSLTASAFSIIANKKPNLNVESFSFFDPLTNYTLEEATQKMKEYNVDNVFLLIRSDQENEYRLILLQKSSLCEFHIKIENNTFITHDQNGGKIRSDYITLLISLLDGMMPFSFLFALEKEGLFEPKLNDRNENIRKISEIQHTYIGIKHLQLFPHTFVFFPENGKLLVQYFYQKGDLASWEIQTSVLGKKDFNTNFNLVIKEGSFFVDFNKLADVVLDATLESYKKDPFTRALHMNAFLQQCVKIKSQTVTA